MDHVGTHYCAFHRKLFKLLGLWPYHTAPILIIWRTIISSIFAFPSFYLILHFYMVGESLGTYMVNVMIISMSLALTSKYIGNWATLMTAKDIMEQVSEDWQTLTNKEELAILNKYTALGRFQLVIFAWTLFSLCGIFLVIHYLPIIMDVIVPLNATRPHLQLYIMTYTTQDEHFYLYGININLVILFGASLLITSDGFTIMNLQHLIALFRIISFRLRCNLRKEPYKSINAMSKFNAGFALRDVVVFHQHSLVFVKCLTRMCSYPYFILLLNALGAMTSTLLRLSQAKSFEEFTLCVLYITPSLIIMFIIHYMVNQTVDYSYEIFTASYDSMWYEMPVFQRKLLLVIMQKARCGANFSFIGLYNPSLKSFARCIKLSCSYFMMVRSVMNE